jgi:hypothetical protein
VCACIRACIRAFVRESVCANLCVRACVLVCVCVSACVCVCVCLSVCVCQVDANWKLINTHFYSMMCELNTTPGEHGSSQPAGTYKGRVQGIIPFWHVEPLMKATCHCCHLFHCCLACCLPVLPSLWPLVPLQRSFITHYVIVAAVSHCCH